MAGFGDVFGSASGWLKVIELILTFITLLIHRHGDNGNYLYFSTTALKLSNSDPNIDAENLGNSTLVAYLVISLVLIIGYIVDGREFIQESILEPIWNFIGTFMFMASGVVAIMTWQGETRAKVTSSSTLTEREYNRDIDAGLAMGAMCIIIGIFYMCDFFVSYFARRKLLSEERA